MIHIAERVEAVECAHSLEAEIRELRLIAAHKPPYNRRSKFPERTAWLKLTDEAYPRLSLVAPGARRRRGLPGPVRLAARGRAGRRRGLRGAAAAPVHAASCRPGAPSPACALAELGRCAAPCELRISPEEYRRRRRPSRSRGARPATRASWSTRLLARIEALAGGQPLRGGGAGCGPGWPRCCGPPSGCSGCAALTALRRAGGGPAASRGAAGRSRWSGTAGWSRPARPRRRRHPRTDPAVLLATAETVRPGPGPTPCASAEETERLLAWLERPEVRLVECPDGWAYPVGGAARFADLLATGGARVAASRRDRARRDRDVSASTDRSVTCAPDRSVIARNGPLRRANRVRSAHANVSRLRSTHP